MVKGTQLPYQQQRMALASYVHRFTGTHTPAWARKPRSDGTAYPVQFKDDADWLANTEFPVTKSGRLGRGDCYSRPTWPNNPELRRS